MSGVCCFIGEMLPLKTSESLPGFHRTTTVHHSLALLARTLLTCPEPDVGEQQDQKPPELSLLDQKHCRSRVPHVGGSDIDEELEPPRSLTKFQGAPNVSIPDGRSLPWLCCRPVSCGCACIVIMSPSPSLDLPMTASALQMSIEPPNQKPFSYIAPFFADCT